MIIISAVILTAWLLFYSYHVSNTLSDHVGMKDMFLTVIFGSIYPFFYVANLVLRLVSKIQIVYYVAIVSPEISEDCE